MENHEVRIFIIYIAIECAGHLYRPVKWQWSCTYVSSNANGFSHVAVRSAVKLFSIVSREICHRYISRKYRLYTMR